MAAELAPPPGTQARGDTGEGTSAPCPPPLQRTVEKKHALVI